MLCNQSSIIMTGQSEISFNLFLLILRMDHFTVVFSVAWLLHDSEAGGDLILIQTSPLLLCKLSRSSTAFEKEIQRGLYKGKVTSSLACIRMPGNLAHNSVYNGPFSSAPAGEKAIPGKQNELIHLRRAG